MFKFLYQHFWQQRHWTLRSLLILLSLLLISRALPYLAPIRSQDIPQNDRAVEFSDRNGFPLGTILSRDQDHTAVVPLKDVSPAFLQAIMAAEDGGFYEHGALDLKAIARSLLQVAQSRKVMSGASTITMQLARMLDNSPRTLSAKLGEIWLSWRLVAGMNRDEILEAYVNRLPMGGNLYGVEAAARVYFGIPATELNLAQASLLAAIPNNPTYLNPYTAWKSLKKRQKYVLNRMVAEGYLTAHQAERIQQENVSLQPRQQGILAAPHFLFWLAKQLPADHSPQIPTTIDKSLQQFVESQVREVVHSLNPHNVHQAAALVLDNSTGEVLAYVGSTDYFSDRALGRNDGVQALRQPGSTLKPFLYQWALENRVIRPNTVLADVPTHYAIPGAKLYSPSDYTETFYGPARVRIALANSLNIPAVKVLEKVGVGSFLGRLRELGFEHLSHPPEYYGLGLTLGSGEVNLWELARAYRIMAQAGQITPLVTQVSQKTDSLPKTPVSFQNIPSWQLITNMLSDRHARAKAFGVDSILNLPFETAVKTGTSSNFRDTWTVGFSQDYTVATWVGNFDGEPMRQVSGVTGAAPLWNRIFLRLHEQQVPDPFDSPKNLLKRPICALSGLKPTPACPSVTHEYFWPEDLADYENHPDTFYQAVTSKNKSYQLNLPPEYNEWLAKQPESPLKSHQLKILFPQDGDRFLSPQGNSAPRLELKIARPNQEAVQWLLNGEQLAEGNKDSLFWPLKPGQWTLTVKNGTNSDHVNFEVQPAKTHTARRGFSLGANP